MANSARAKDHAGIPIQNRFISIFMISDKPVEVTNVCTVDPDINVLEPGPGSGSGSGQGPSVAAAPLRGAAALSGPGPDPGPEPDPDPGPCSEQ